MVHNRREGDINLQPGDIWFGNKPVRLYTLLGSCVAVTVWHPKLKYGGMCHYLLPSDKGYRKPCTQNSKSGMYADNAIAYFEQQIRKKGLKTADFEVKVFGAGNMFGLASNELNVADNNAKYAYLLLKQYGFKIKAVDLGGRNYRKVYLDLVTGDVWMTYGKST